MSFESLRKEKFDPFRPPHLGLESSMVWQIEWFANKAGTTIGTLALGKADVPAATAVGMLLQRCGYKIVSAQFTPSRCPIQQQEVTPAASQAMM